VFFRVKSAQANSEGDTWKNLPEPKIFVQMQSTQITASCRTVRLSLFSARFTRKTLAFLKDVKFHEAAVAWEDAYYNRVRPHKSLRIEMPDDPQQKWARRAPTMAASLADRIWTVKELLFTVPLPGARYTC
jgi:hypothetical protein